MNGCSLLWKKNTSKEYEVKINFRGSSLFLPVKEEAAYKYYEVNFWLILFVYTSHL